MIDAAQAWDIFITGFTGTPHARHVVTLRTAGPLLQAHFEGEAHTGPPFDEFFVRACNPQVALAAVAAAQPLPEHYVTVFDDAPGLVAEYERGGYRHSHSEAIMVYQTKNAPPQTEDVVIIRSAADAAWANEHDSQKKRWVRDANLADPDITHYVVIHDGLPVARGRNHWINGTYGYVSEIYTAPEYRRRGLAQRIMKRLLADDAARGISASVLTASSEGEPLYARLGYRALAIIHILVPAHAEMPLV